MRFRRPSGAMVVACVALFFSLGGAGLAASGGGHSFRFYKGAMTTVQLGFGNFFLPCNLGDRAIGVAYTGLGDVVTVSDPQRKGGYEGWKFTAHRDPNYKRTLAPFITAGAICVHAS